MDENQFEAALDVVDALARGVHPTTGEEMREESVYQQAKVARALFAAADALRRRAAAAKRRATLPGNTGRRWDRKDDDKLRMEFEKGLTLEEIAERSSRTVGAVVARLVKIGSIDVRNIPRSSAGASALVEIGALKPKRALPEARTRSGQKRRRR